MLLPAEGPAAGPAHAAWRQLQPAQPPTACQARATPLTAAAHHGKWSPAAAAPPCPSPRAGLRYSESSSGREAAPPTAGREQVPGGRRGEEGAHAP